MEARATRAVAEVSSAEAVIAALKLMVEKLRREIYGQRSERKARLVWTSWSCSSRSRKQARAGPFQNLQSANCQPADTPGANRR